VTGVADNLETDEREPLGAASRTVAAPNPGLGRRSRGPLPPEQRRNIALLGLDMAIFMMALGAIGQLTIIPLFVSRLTDSSLAVGAVTAAFQLGWLPQVFVAGYVERSQRKWPWVIWLTPFERGSALLLAVCALLAPSLGVAVLPIVFFACFSQTLFGGLALTPWLDVIARVVPGRLRGRFMGTSNMLGAVLGAGTAALVAPLLDWYEFPYNFAACFGLAGVIFAIGMIPIFLVKEPPGPPPRPPHPLRVQLAELPRVLTGDPAFRRFVLGLCCSAFGTMSSGFLVVYGVRELGAPDEVAGWYTATLFISQIGASMALGWLGDRHGFAAVGQAVVVATVAIGVVAVLAPDPNWLLVAFLAQGVVSTGGMLARLTGPMDYAPTERRPSYVALSAALVGPCAAIAPMVGGQIVDLLGYPWLFGISSAVALTAVPLLGAGARPQVRRHI
jgi:MFS family permease